MLMPMLTEADPKVSAEGWIDPLGMYAIADALAVRMIPGVRERQTHPRFLTSIAVSLSLCSEFDEDVVAADGVSKPWQVFEWYFVEGMVRSTRDTKLLRGLPGQDKASRAIKDRVYPRRHVSGVRSRQFDVWLAIAAIPVAGRDSFGPHICDRR